MASFTSRLAGWAAGRLGGEKSRKKTMEFVDKTGVGKLLSLAGDAALLGGAGKLAGMGASAVGAKMGLGKAAKTAADATAMVAPAGPYRVSDLSQFARLPGSSAASGMPSFTPSAASRTIQQMSQQQAMVPQSLTQRLGSAASGAMDYLKKRPEIATAGLTAVSGARQAAANRQLDREALAQRQSQFEQEFGLRKGEQEREVERQRRIAQLLAPLFQRISGGQG
jgi:hypothetical protein